jgi:type II secretory pathway pseudopilin PulG
LVVALALLLMRVLVMGKAQEKRQRANRQQTERLKSLVSAYRVLAGSFQPLRESETIQDIDRGAIEAALSDILLFGSANQVAMAAACANALVDGDVPPLSALVTDLRRDLRAQLGLAPLDEALALPQPGPLRGGRAARRNGESREAEMAGRGGGGGGGLGGGLLLGSGASAGLHAEDGELHR